jgi:hypothetical protein
VLVSVPTNLFAPSIVPPPSNSKTVAPLVVEWNVCLCLFDVVWLILVYDEADIYIYISLNK